MQSPWGSPITTAPLPKNYSDTFNTEEYEAKSSLELESYARNLKNLLMSYLQQDPFPAFLFEKLEKRLDGITSILAKRSAASHVLNKDQARQRLQELSARIDPVSVDAELPATSRAMGVGPPLKKRKFEYLDDIKKAQAELKDKEKFTINEEAEEEEESPKANSSSLFHYGCEK